MTANVVNLSETNSIQQWKIHLHNSIGVNCVNESKSANMLVERFCPTTPR